MTDESQSGQETENRRESKPCPDSLCERAVFDPDELLGHLLRDHELDFEAARFGALGAFPPNAEVTA